MPWSLEVDIDDPDELADWFEQHGPSPDNRRPIKEYWLECIAEVRGTSPWGKIAELVAAARNTGASWLQIGEALDISAASAEHRFGSVELVQAAQAESLGLEL